MNTQAVQEQPKTTYYRDSRGKPKAETIVHLFDKFWLKISTHKVFLGGLVTSAHVHKADGMFDTHRMNIDHFMRLEDNKVRVTEKAVKVQHERVLLSLEAIKAAALSHTQKVEADRELYKAFDCVGVTRVELQRIKHMEHLSEAA